MSVLHATLSPVDLRFTTLKCKRLPTVGEIIAVEQLGPALVEAVSPHFIRIQIQESQIGRFSSTHALEVNP